VTNRIAIFFHCLFYYGTPPRLIPNALAIVHEQMWALRESGLLEACDEMIVGCNGGDESVPVARRILPEKARVIMHGLESRSENLTIVEIEKWAPKHPGWSILYFHTKGITHTPGTEYHHVSSIWRRTMMADLITNWQRCVSDLKMGYDVACSCWEWGMCDGTQNIAPGNFWWARSDFINKLPGIHERSRIKQSGIASAESRFESEVWIGNGQRPQVKQYREHWRPWQLIGNVNA